MLTGPLTRIEEMIGDALDWIGRGRMLYQMDRPLSADFAGDQAKACLIEALNALDSVTAADQAEAVNRLRRVIEELGGPAK